MKVMNFPKLNPPIVYNLMLVKTAVSCSSYSVTFFLLVLLQQKNLSLGKWSDDSRPWVKGKASWLTSVPFSSFSFLLLSITVIAIILPKKISKEKSNTVMKMVEFYFFFFLQLDKNSLSKFWFFFSLSHRMRGFCTLLNLNFYFLTKRRKREKGRQ